MSSRLDRLGVWTIRAITGLGVLFLAIVALAERAAQVGPADAEKFLKQWTGLEWPVWLFGPVGFWTIFLAVAGSIGIQLALKNRSDESRKRAASVIAERHADQIHREGVATRGGVEAVGGKVEAVGERLDGKLQAHTAVILDAVSGADAQKLVREARTIADDIERSVKKFFDDFVEPFPPEHSLAELHAQQDNWPVSASERELTRLYQPLFAGRVAALRDRFAVRNLFDHTLGLEGTYREPVGSRAVYAAINGLRELANRLEAATGSVRVEIIGRVKKPKESHLIRLSVRLTNLRRPPVNFQPVWSLEILSGAGERLGGTMGKIEFLAPDGTIDSTGALVPLQAEGVYNVQMTFFHLPAADQERARIVLVGSDLRGNELRSEPFPKAGGEMASFEDRVAALLDSGFSLAPTPTPPPGVAPPPSESV